ncbi:LOW QUALITY PROTEIN: TauE domain-containing protein [Cephalotus follicularis]|uniref:TauE domain-containing protein n=1 Tax=Cephalotus follicularis TaxID=3775 RepID=A0A1Q3B9E5_CEPFO|nr:LOW QUALITY PROTEIN: TauE domain-containing protein [Cephalotus follicularis]
MGRIGSKWWSLIGFLVIASVLVLADTAHEAKSYRETEDVESSFATKVSRILQQNGHRSYQHVWPEMRFGWKIVVGSIIGLFGASCGGAGGAGGGGIFVTMLTLIIGFDAKSAAALSKCMVTGIAVASVSFNIRRRHPTLERPIIDYDLALLFQPMLLLGISLGVTLSVLAEWMLTVLQIILLFVISTVSFLKGVDTWKKENIKKKELVMKRSNSNVQLKNTKITVKQKPKNLKGQRIDLYNQVSIIENVYWKDLGLLLGVWIAMLALHIAKNYTTTCSVLYWVLVFLQIPVTVGVSGFEAYSLLKGRRKIASMGEAVADWRVPQLVFYCFCGLMAGVLGGLLGLGGGFILSPVFWEMGIPPLVSVATAGLAMLFSASLTVIEFYLLNRFPVPYALYLFGVATIAASVTQHGVRRLIDMLGRTSIIIFTLTFAIFVSALSLGGVGVVNIAQNIEHKESMGFDHFCSYA